MSKKNSIKVSLRDEENDEVADLGSLKELAERGSVVEEVVAPAMVASTVDYPITLQYGADQIRISGRERVRVADFNKLPAELPKGLVSKKL